MTKIFEISFGRDINCLDSCYFQRRKDSEGMPWSHGNRQDYKRNRKIPTEGTAGVIDKEETSEILCRPIPRDRVWAQERRDYLIEVVKDTVNNCENNWIMAEVEETIADFREFKENYYYLIGEKDLQFSGMVFGLLDKIENVFSICQRINNEEKIIYPEEELRSVKGLVDEIRAIIYEGQLRTKGDRKSFPSSFTEKVTQTLDKDESEAILGILRKHFRLIEIIVNGIEGGVDLVLERVDARKNAKQLREELTRAVLFHYFNGFSYNENGSINPSQSYYWENHIPVFSYWLREKGVKANVEYRDWQKALIKRDNL